MVEKIDRPEHRPIYEVRESKETKEDQHYQHNPREEMEKKYREELEGGKKEWDKFGARNTVIKPIVVPRDRISKMLLRSVILFKGVGILQADVIWKDGRKTAGALIRLDKMESYFQLKRMRPQTDVPEIFWNRNGNVELGIVQSISASSSFPIQRPAEKIVAEVRPTFNILRTLGFISLDGKTNWGVIFIYTFIASILTITLVYELSKF